MAHKKAGGSTQLGRDSIAKRLGVKLFEGQAAAPGAILIRQRGSKFRAGVGVKRGGDDTLFATANGVVHFVTKKVRKFNGKLEKANFVHVTPGEVMVAAKAAKVTSSAKSKAFKKSKGKK